MGGSWKKENIISILTAFYFEDHACLCFNKASVQILSRLYDHRKHFGFFCLILTEFVSVNQMQEGFSSVVGFAHPLF